MADLSTREPGWYWVRRLWSYGPGRWFVAEYAADDQTFFCSGPFPTEEIEIGPRIYLPGEDREREELLAALREVCGALVSDNGDRESELRILEQRRATAIATLMRKRRQK